MTRRMHTLASFFIAAACIVGSVADPINRDFSRWLKAEFARGPLSDVYPPATTYADRHTVTLGGKRAIMVHTGVVHAPDSSAIYFPDERTVFGGSKRT